MLSCRKGALFRIGGGSDYAGGKDRYGNRNVYNIFPFMNVIYKQTAVLAQAPGSRRVLSGSPLSPAASQSHPSRDITSFILFPLYGKYFLIRTGLSPRAGITAQAEAEEKAGRSHKEQDYARHRCSLTPT